MTDIDLVIRGGQAGLRYAYQCAVDNYDSFDDEGWDVLNENIDTTLRAIGVHINDSDNDMVSFIGSDALTEPFSEEVQARLNIYRKAFKETSKAYALFSDMVDNVNREQR